MTQTRKPKSFKSRGAAGPIEFTLDEDAPYFAIPAIFAEEFGKFMEFQAAIAAAASKINRTDKDGDKKDDEKTDPDEIRKAVEEIVNQSLLGLSMVLLDESLERMNVRVKSREKPVDVGTLSDIFSYLVNIYNGGTGDAEADATDPSSDGANESVTSLALTGGSSEADSSSATSPSTSEPVAQPQDAAPAAVIPAASTEAPAPETPAPVAEPTTTA